jgi:transposase
LYTIASAWRGFSTFRSSLASATDLARLDRKRKKRTSNKDCRSPVGEDARIAKMKDGRTHLAHKAVHAVDLDSGAAAVTLQAAGNGYHSGVAL